MINQQRITKIRNLAQQNLDQKSMQDHIQEDPDQIKEKGGNNVANDYIEVPKNDTIALNRDDLQII